MIFYNILKFPHVKYNILFFNFDFDSNISVSLEELSSINLITSFCSVKTPFKISYLFNKGKYFSLKEQ